MPLPENVPSYLSGPEAERMITVDPVRYMANIKTLQDIPRNACLLHLLNHIQDKQWPLLRDDGILEFVAQAMQSQLAISSSYGLMHSMHTQHAWNSSEIPRSKY